MLLNDLLTSLGYKEDESELFATFDFIWDLNSKKGDENFVLKVSDINSYDDGNVGTRYVFECKPTGKFYEFFHYTNSWADDYGDDEIELTEVFPREKVVIVYETKQP